MITTIAKRKLEREVPKGPVENHTNSKIASRVLGADDVAVDAEVVFGRRNLDEFDGIFDVPESCRRMDWEWLNRA